MATRNPRQFKSITPVGRFLPAYIPVWGQQSSLVNPLGTPFGLAGWTTENVSGTPTFGSVTPASLGSALYGDIRINPLVTKITCSTTESARMRSNWFSVKSNYAVELDIDMLVESTSEGGTTFRIGVEFSSDNGVSVDTTAEPTYISRNEIAYEPYSLGRITRAVTTTPFWFEFNNTPYITNTTNTFVDRWYNIRGVRIAGNAVPSAYDTFEYSKLNNVYLAQMSQYNATTVDNTPYEALVHDHDVSTGKGPWPIIRPSTSDPLLARIVIELDNTAGAHTNKLYIQNVNVLTTLKL